ncbi:MAG: iron export ABC transporter permease subunit FetB [Candidatus Lokiarchaeota archaeon]|nr:iron export ABC transporter permease subunit FetB [Candidatus Lokiarchaeota archaeon]
MWDINLIVTSLISLGISTILVVISLILSRIFKFSMEKEIVIGCTQAVIQLLIIGFIMYFIFYTGYVFLIIILLAIMLVVGALLIFRNYRYIKGSFFISIISLTASASITLTILLGTGIVEFDMYSLMAFGGIIIGNSMKRGSVAFENFIEEVKKQKKQIELKLSLGANKRESLNSSISSSVYICLLPTLNSLKAIGIVWIPGGMLGMLLGGVSPIWAAVYQAIIMFSILCAGLIVSILITTFLSRIIINKRLQVNNEILYGEKK